MFRSRFYPSLEGIITINQNDKIVSTQKYDWTTSPYWRQLIEPRNLWLGWQKVRTNRGGAGGDGVSIAAFEHSAAPRIDRLAADLAHGRYRPGPLRRVAVPKRHGGERELAIPCIVDRVVQTTAAQLISPVLEAGFHRASFAYRPGRGVVQAVQAVLRYRREGYRWAAEGDVAHCFDEIPHDQLLDRLEHGIGDPRLTDLVALWLQAYAPEGLGIPQGSPISPLLCNLHLDAVDAAIDGHGVRLVRYADDFVILTKNESKARSALEDMAAQLRFQGLSLNPEKSRVVPADQALRFLGHVFIRSLAFKEVEAGDDLVVPPDAPSEELLEQWVALSNRERVEEEEEVDPRPSRLRALYLLEPGATLSVRNQSFLALGPEELDARGEPHRAGRLVEHAKRIDRIEIGPHASADWEALGLAAAHGVPLAMVDGHGGTVGWLSGPGDIRGRRVLAQACFLADPARQETLAMAIVHGRVRNQYLHLQRLNRSRSDPDLAAGAVELKRMTKGLPQRARSAEANGLEGNAARIYWPLYAKALGRDFEFSWEEWHRERRPPPDPVNACLGYLCGILERDLRAAVEHAGLHPGMAGLHTARDGADSLIYDLMEGFRAALPEAILATMLARSQLRPEHFVVREEVNGAGNRARDCRIELAGRRALIQGYESWISRPIKSRRSSKFVTWRALLDEEARAMADLFLGEADSFTPYEIDY